MKFSKVLFLLSLIPSALGSSSDDVTPPPEASADDAVSEAIAEEVALEVYNETVTAMAGEPIEDVTEAILEAIDAVEEASTGITSSASGLVTQILNEILGTEGPTPAPTVYVKPETAVDQVIGKITDTVNTIAEGTGNVLNEAFNEPPTEAP